MASPDALLRQFETFCRYIRILSKDQGLVPLHLWSTQRYIITELLHGVQDDVRDFVILKPRQVGATTVLAVFTLFWHLRHPAMQGGYVAHKDDATALFRDNMGEMAAHIDNPRFTYPIRASNRNMIAWTNASRLQYQTAGTKENTGLGRSKGLTYLFADEVAHWGGLSGIQSLKATLSDRHPARLSIWASTANGYNHFHGMWLTGQHAVTSRAIFSAWWRHELYRTNAVPQGDRIFEVYWDGRLNAEEVAWQEEITQRWGVTLGPEQWAWWRWQLAEKHHDDLNMMHQEFPTLPEHAFQSTGRGFLPGGVMARIREQIRMAPQPEYYRYYFGDYIEQTQVLPTTSAMAQLRIWEEPRQREKYIIAADPAYGNSPGSPYSDYSTISVWRVERSRLVQVAEFSATEVQVSKFAWVICHLCGAYQEPFLILEMNGPGIPVWQEIISLQNYGWGTMKLPQLRDVIGAIQYYIFRRPDAMAGRGFYQWKSSNQLKAWICHRLRDRLISHQVLIRSAELVAELAAFRQDGNVFGATDGAHDDRVITLALAVHDWNEQLIPLMESEPLTMVGNEIAPVPWPPSPGDWKPRSVADVFERLNAISRG